MTAAKHHRLSRMTLRVLHVTESYGGGVLAAIRDYVVATPEVEHHLLFAAHDDAPLGADALAGFASTQQLPRGHVAAIRATRAYARALKPDIVHAHSSFAGAYTRLALRAAGDSKKRPRLAYTPHCYAFERRDLGGVARLAYRLIEYALARNTDVFAACSPREAKLSNWPLARAKVVVVPNVAPIERRTIDFTRLTDKRRLTVVGAGRIRPEAKTQKAPLFFLAAVEATRSAGQEVDAVWIGGGDTKIEQRLTDAGIRVTGWLDRAAVLDVLASSDVYLHSGAWEGFPIAVLEADALGIPQIVRAIPAFDCLDLPAVAATAADVPALLAALQSGPTRTDNASAVRAALATNTPECQRAALQAAWALPTKADACAPI